IAALDPAQLLQSLLERREADLHARIVRSPGHEHADAAHLLGLLRARRERPRGCCAAEERNEFAPPHVWHGLSSLPFWRELMSYSTSRSACRRAVGASLGQT